MKPSTRRPESWQLCSVATAVVLAFASASPAQPASDAVVSNAATERIRLDNDTASDSQIESLRKEWTFAIIHGAPPQSIQRLIDRRRQVDNRLAATLKTTQDQLADIKSDGFDPDQTSVVSSLRRTRSLAWLNRIELAALQSECFSAGTPDAVAAAAQTIELIDNAAVDLSANSLIRDEIDRLRIEAHLQAGDGWEADRASSPAANTGASPGIQPNELALSIRVDLSNRRYDQAESKLRSFYRTEPRSAPASAPMDFAMLEFLWATSKEDEKRMGNWLDTMQQRGGLLARQRGETYLARKRQLRPADETVSADPRLLRADGRYYYRVEKPMQAAVAYARASVQDDQAARAIESAVSSAAILKKLSKNDAAKELLLQVANRYPSHPPAADLVLQAATLASESKNADPSEVTDILNRCLHQWPESTAAVTARDWLIDSFVQAGEWIDAAKLATRLPNGHWNESNSRRCQTLWQRAVVEAIDHEDALRTMRDQLNRAAESTEHPDVIETRCTLLILLSDDLGELPELSKLIKDETMRAFARFRESPSKSTTPMNWSHDASGASFHAAIRWRLQRDIQQRPAASATVAAFLLTHYAETNLATLRWMVQSGQIDRATELMRSQLQSGTHRAAWLQTMADALMDSPPATTAATGSQRQSRWKLAARLWDELADGLPENDPKSIASRVKAIQCRYQSGDRIAASAQAQLMLLTNPPGEVTLLNILTEIGE